MTASAYELTTDTFSTVQGFRPEPCLRRKFGGSFEGILAFCTPAENASNGARAGGDQERQPSLSPLEVAQILIDRAIALAPEPRIQVAPEHVGLTGLDSYFWLEEPAPIRASAGVGGLIVTAEARPVQYVWDFGDGNDKVTSHPGRPWTKDRPGDISHLYETRGRYELVLDQIWEARWQINGGAWETIGFFSNSGGRPYPVREVVPVLVLGSPAP